MINVRSKYIYTGIRYILYWLIIGNAAANFSLIITKYIYNNTFLVSFFVVFIFLLLVLKLETFFCEMELTLRRVVFMYFLMFNVKALTIVFVPFNVFAIDIHTTLAFGIIWVVSYSYLVLTSNNYSLIQD